MIDIFILNDASHQEEKILELLQSSKNIQKEQVLDVMKTLTTKLKIISNPILK